MSSFLHKIIELKKHPDLIHEFQRDLQGLKSLVEHRFVRQHGTDGRIREWVKQVRELFHDVEDWIDLNPQMNLGYAEREAIEDFRTQIQEAHDRFRRYGLLDKASTAPGFAPSKVTIDSPAVFEDKTCLVGVEDRRNDVGKHLTDEHVKTLKVVFIVGAEGLGKTTLAKDIYAEFKGQFECQAFVSLGRRPSVRKTLQDILHQVNPMTLESDPDLQQAISMLRECLHTKRYFIVIDGVWSTWAWKVINCALPDMDSGSRVMATTCILDVAKSCCSDVICRMEALNEDDSRRLFHSRIFLQEFDANNILKMCCGMPLAITVAAGLLGRKSAELAELKILEKYILSASDQYSTSEGIKMVLLTSYADLPSPVKPCFLYLGVFLEDYIIKKDRLVRLWEAEGLVSKPYALQIGNEVRSLGTGVSYFNELISRGLIQPVFNFDDDQAVGCTVHGAILDFIKSLSREENFSTTAAELISDPFPCDAIRRFSLNSSNEDEADTLKSSSMHLSSMRSLTVFGHADGLFDSPDLSSDSENDENDDMYVSCVPGNYRNLIFSFRLIRVLDLEDIKSLKYHHLEGIGGLVLLTYLGLGGPDILFLPEEIGQLVHLETLDVRWTNLMSLPTSVVKLQKLVNLLLGEGFVGTDQSLGTPKKELSFSPNSTRSLALVAELLSKSKQMRILSVTLDKSFVTEADLLTNFLNVVVNSGLQSLSIYCPSFFNNDELVYLLVDIWKTVTASSATSKLQGGAKQTSQLRRFELKISSPLIQVPPNMFSLVSLTHLVIQIGSLENRDLSILGGLRNLVLLNLAMLFPPQDNCILRKDMFPPLKVFSFVYLNGWSSQLEFAKGAMPQLRRLGLGLRAMGELDNGDVGIEHLTSLASVHATIDCWHATGSQVDAAEAYIRTQVSANSNRPTLEMTREKQDQMKIDEEQHSKK